MRILQFWFRCIKSCKGYFRYCGRWRESSKSCGSGLPVIAAIGKEGQNARLAARLTGFKIDIKSETQARESGDFLDYENDYEDDEYDDNYEYDEEGYYKDPDATEEIPTEAEASTEEAPVEETSADETSFEE